MEKKITHDHKSARLTLRSGRDADLDRLRAGLEETEHTARHAFGDHNDATPQWSELASGVVHTGGDDLDDLVPTGDSGISRHVVLNDPARMLRWVEAVRDVIGYAEEVWSQVSAGDDRSMLRGSSGAYGMVLRRFAAVFEEETTDA